MCAGLVQGISFIGESNETIYLVYFPVSTDKIIEETADMWAFAAHWTELNVGDGK
jgi:heme/copper-type cytochrome/quinol oxidase subunit 1